MLLGFDVDVLLTEVLCFSDLSQVIFYLVVFFSYGTYILPMPDA